MNSSPKIPKPLTKPTLRIIPRLDIKGPNLVKGIHLEGLRVLGKPEHFARFYYENGADELLFMDIVASLYGRNNLLEIVERTAREIFIPLTVGGGIRSLEDIRRILRAGADKVSVNTAAIKRPEFIKEASRKFGSSTIVISIEAIRLPDGSYEAFTDNGREKTGIDPFRWAVQVAKLGAGEILVTSIDREGTGKGFDLELTQRISEAVSIPVIACGGAGKVEHVYDAVKKGKVQAVCLSSLLHYHFVKNHPLEGEYDAAINLSARKSQKGFDKIEDANLQEVKGFLVDRGIECRHELMGKAND